MKELSKEFEGKFNCPWENTWKFGKLTTENVERAELNTKIESAVLNTQALKFC